MTSYPIAYAAAWINAAIGGIAGVLAAAYLTVHPSWLTGDVAVTCGIIVPICGVLATLLPSITRTPAQREQNYLKANMGELPKDIAAKYPATVVRPEILPPH